MSSPQRLQVRLEPSKVLLRRRRARPVHDVGEVSPIQVSQGKVTLRVVAEDPATGRTPPAIVRVGGRSFRVNEPFEYELRAEFNEKTKSWMREPIWVESDEYSSEEVDYEVAVEE